MVPLNLVYDHFLTSICWLLVQQNFIVEQSEAKIKINQILRSLFSLGLLTCIFFDVGFCVIFFDTHRRQ